MTRVIATAQIELFASPDRSSSKQGELSPGAGGDLLDGPTAGSDGIQWCHVQFDSYGAASSFVDGAKLNNADTGQPIVPDQPQPPDGGGGNGEYSASVEAKNVLDPKYGGKGNDVDDDWAAIKAAMDDSKGSARGLIRFPIGSYKISKPIHLGEQQAVTFRGDCVDALQYGKLGCGSAIKQGADGQWYLFDGPDKPVNNATWEDIGMYAWGGIRMNNCRQILMKNTHFAGVRGFISPELWTGVFINTDWAGGNEPGSVAIFAHPGASLNVIGIQCTAFDRGLVLKGTGGTIDGFRMEVGNHAIVLGEDLDGNKAYANCFRICSGTMEANNTAIKLRNAAYSTLEGIWIQGHEHKGFGHDGMCGSGIEVEYATFCAFNRVMASGGFANGGYYDIPGAAGAQNCVFEGCGFNVNLTVLDDAASGSTVLRFARGTQTSMPQWLKPGLLIANMLPGDSANYPGGRGTFTDGTKVKSVGVDSVTLDRPTIAAIKGMTFYAESGQMEGNSAIGFYDSRDIKVGGGFLNEPARNLVQMNNGVMDVQP